MTTSDKRRLSGWSTAVVGRLSAYGDGDDVGHANACTFGVGCLVAASDGCTMVGTAVGVRRRLVV